jgi:hypothetical protein
MPIAGLVLTLSDSPAEVASTRARLAADPRITVGASDGARVPVVTDTADSEEERALVDALCAEPGVRFVEVSFHAFDDALPEEVN